jgi:hypothetical protein
MQIFVDFDNTCFFTFQWGESIGAKKFFVKVLDFKFLDLENLLQFSKCLYMGTF